MKLEEYIKVIEKFIADYLKDSHMDGYVIGLSGGVDSSLVAALTKSAVGKEKLMCIMMPIESNPADLKDAISLAESLDLNYLVIDGTDTYHAMINDFKKQGQELDKGSLSNLKVRIRMCILYAYGQTHRQLVIGTDNMDEHYTGYFTKYGDGGVDLLPIVYLTKAEVVKAAKIKGVPTYLAERVPTAGLFAGQTDEGEMGVSYHDLDTYLLGGKVDEEVEKKILRLHRISEHKRNEIPSPEEFKRD